MERLERALPRGLWAELLCMDPRQPQREGAGGALEGQVGWGSGSMWQSLHGAPRAEVSAQPFCTRKSGLKCLVWDLCMWKPSSK